MTNYHDFVSKFYRMDPSTEDIAKSGYQLCDGMIVLIESTMMRENNDEDREKAGYESPRNSYDEDRLLKNNRWCLVTQYEQVRHHDQIKFVGVFADGTKALFHYGEGHGWLFKLNCTRTDALIVSEQEWEDLNASGMTVDEFETMVHEEIADPTYDEPEDDRPVENVPYRPVFHVQVAYLMCGDLTGEDWCHTVMSYHKDKGDIVDYRHLDTTVGAWGMSSVMFTFDVEFDEDRATWDNVKSLVEDKILYMVGDSDYKLIDVGLVNPIPTPANS